MADKDLDDWLMSGNDVPDSTEPVPDSLPVDDVGGSQSSDMSDVKSSDMPDVNTSDMSDVMMSDNTDVMMSDMPEVKNSDDTGTPPDETDAEISADDLGLDDLWADTGMADGGQEEKASDGTGFLTSDNTDMLTSDITDVLTSDNADMLMSDNTDVKTSDKPDSTGTVDEIDMFGDSLDGLIADMSDISTSDITDVKNSDITDVNMSDKPDSQTPDNGEQPPSGTDDDIWDMDDYVTEQPDSTPETPVQPVEQAADTQTGTQTGDGDAWDDWGDWDDNADTDGDGWSDPAPEQTAPVETPPKTTSDGGGDGLWGDDALDDSTDDWGSATTVMAPVNEKPDNGLMGLEEFSDPAPTSEETDDDTEGSGIGKRIAIIALAVVLAAGVGVGGWFAWQAFQHHQETVRQEQAASEAEQQLAEAKTGFDTSVDKANTLMKKIEAGEFKDNETLKPLVTALQTAVKVTPRNTVEGYKTATDSVESGYEKLNTEYQKLVKAKLGDVETRLREAVSKAESLKDAPDGDDKTAMLKLAEQWKDATVSEKNFDEASEALSKLNELNGKVETAKQDKEKQDADAKAAEEAQKQAEEQSQQQSYTPSYTPQKQQSTTPSTPSTPSTPQWVPDTGGGTSGGNLG